MKKIKKTYPRDQRRQVPLILFILSVLLLLAGCRGIGNAGLDENAGSPYAGRPAADLSDYAAMEGYEGDTRLVETDVAEAVDLMEKKKSFALFLSYADCDYCNCIMPYVNEAAEETGQYVGYINTRKDPSWMSNTDIKDYDLFVKHFGDYLQEDEEGNKHLYTPDIYFIRDGRIADRHEGVLPGEDIDPAQALTDSQEETLRQTLTEKFREISR